MSGGQTKLESLVEVLANIMIGMVVTVLASPVIYSWFNATFTLAQNIGLTMVFTVLSVVRGYIVRRWFNNNMKGFSRKVASFLKGSQNALYNHKSRTV